MLKPMVVLALCLMMTSCAFLTPAIRGQNSTLAIPSEYLIKCQRDLPPLKKGDRESVQEHNKSVQNMYHQCVDKDSALIDELKKQGVKGIK